MFQSTGIIDWIVDGVERIAMHHDIARLSVVQGGEGIVHRFDPINWPVNRPKDISRHRQPMQKMAGPIGFNHQKAKPRGHIIGGKNIAGDGQSPKGILVGKGRVRLIFIGPFNEIIVDIIPSNQSFAICCGKDDSTLAHPVGFFVSVKPVIARNHRPRFIQNAKMLEMHGPTVADFNVIFVGVKSNGDPVLHLERAFIGNELAAIKHHPLAGRPGRGDPAVFGLDDQAIPEVEGLAIGGQQHR